MSERIPMPHLAARIFDTPLLIAQEKLDAILHVLAPRMEFEIEVAAEAPEVERVSAEQYQARIESLAPVGTRAQRRAEGYYVLNDVAVVPVIGTLVHRSSWMDALSGMTSYGNVESMVGAAIRDPMVREILLDIDSPGGEASGAFDTSDRLRSMRGKKPIVSIASEVATSGAYLIASSADEIVLPRSGVVGSVGVVGAHLDHSKAMERRGVAVTYIYAGERKVDGSPFMPLSEAARNEWQAKIDSLYGLFVETIAQNIGMTPAKIRDTRAAIYMGPKAIEAGLAHRLASFEQELSAAVARQAGPFRLDAQTKGTDMSDQQQQGNGGTATLTAADVERARIEARAEGHAAGVKEGGAAAVTAERTRIKAILTSEPAQNRTKLASHIALNTDMSAEAASEMLAASPPEGKQSKLDAAMSRTGTPGIKANEPGGDDAERKVPVMSAISIFESRQQRAQAMRSGK